MSSAEISKIEDIYGRFACDFLTELRSDEFYTYFMNAVKSGERNVLLHERFIDRDIDVRWIEMIENTLIPLDTIIRTPQRFIKNEEEIVPIEMVRNVTTESIRHLAQHTNMIARVEGDEVTPERMLNILKEESFETYENRFLYTLLQKLEYFLDKRLQALVSSRKSQDAFEIKLDGTCEAGRDKIAYNIEFSYITPHVELSKEDLKYNVDTSRMTNMQRIERIRKILYDFKGSALIKSLHGCALVRPPLNMTNVLTKNQNFRKAVDLWMFIEQYDEAGYSVTSVERDTVPTDAYMDEIFSLVALQYIIMKRNSGNPDEYVDYSERKTEILPNLIKKEIDKLLDNYDMEIDEIKRIFVDRIEKKRRKKFAQFAKIRDVITRVTTLETETLQKAMEGRKPRAERLAKEMERREREKQRLIELERKRREAEEQERLRREAEEQERIRREAEEQERLRLEAEEQERLRLEAEEQERLRLEAEEQERLRQEAEEQERLRREAEEQERLRREAEEQERQLREAEEWDRLCRAAEERERQRLDAEEQERQLREAELQEQERLKQEAEAARRAKREARKNALKNLFVRKKTKAEKPAAAEQSAEEPKVLSSAELFGNSNAQSAQSAQPARSTNQAKKKKKKSKGSGNTKKRKSTGRSNQRKSRRRARRK